MSARVQITLPRGLRRTLRMLIAVLVSVSAVVTHAPSAGAAVVDGDSVVVTPETLRPYLSDAEAVTLEATLRPLSQSEVTAITDQLAKPASDQWLRVILPERDEITVLDFVVEDATHSRLDEYRFDESLTKISAAPALIRVRPEGDELVARFNERYGDPELQPAAGAPITSAAACDDCKVTGLAGTIYSAAKCSTVATCTLLNGLQSFVWDEGCTLLFGCSSPGSVRSVDHHFATHYGHSCTQISCSFAQWIRDGNSHVTNISQSIQWVYPGHATARRSNGNYAHIVSDSRSNLPFTQTAADQPYRRYEWTFYATDFDWTRCAAFVDYAMTVKWADGQWASTGWARNMDKPFRTDFGCPDYSWGI